MTDRKKDIREKIIPWEGLARANVISEDDANHIKILEKQSSENKNSTILSQLQLYTNTILHLLNKLSVNSRDEVLKNVLVLINDFLLELPNQEFATSLLELGELDESLPFAPLLKHLENSNVDIKILVLYNLVILLRKNDQKKVDKEIVIKVFDALSGPEFLGNLKNSSVQFIAIQLLQELVTPKYYKEIYLGNNLVSNFKPINQLIGQLARLPNLSGIQLLYDILLTTWILSFNGQINKQIIHNYPELIGNLLTISKDSIKLKVVRLAVSTLKNLISSSVSGGEQFKTIKLILFHDGLNTIKVLQERKFALSTSDEELSNDLIYLNEELTDVVENRLTSFDEYLTELENPNLISWSSPTHKSTEFWLENSGKFKDSGFKLVKRIFEVLGGNIAPAKVILLSDLQYLIQNLGNDLIAFINEGNDGQYKLLIMNLLDKNDGDSELKYQALKTIQLLVGHNYWWEMKKKEGSKLLVQLF